MNEGLSRPRALFSLPTGSSASQHVMLPSLTLRGCNPEIPVAPGEEHYVLDKSLDEVYFALQLGS